MNETVIDRLDELGVDFYSLRHYKLMKLLNMAGIEESEDILDDMLASQAYLEEYGIRGSLKKGSFVYFGHYGKRHGPFAGRPMAWKVLKLKEKQMMLVSWFSIDSKMMFNQSENNTSWENSDIRSWLNSVFLEEYFSDNEKKAIINREITVDGKRTSDTVFLLSESEVKANAELLRGCNSLSGWRRSWWLRDIRTERSSGYYSWSETTTTTYMSCASSEEAECSETSSDSEREIRPAILIPIDSELYKLVTTPRDNLIDESKPIRFGSYPQGSNKDVDLPIEWVILSFSSSKVKLMSKYILDWKPFYVQSKNKESQAWLSSSLRKWLNMEFLEKAFTEEERAFISLEDSGLYDDTYDEFCPDYAVNDAESRHSHTEDNVKVMCPSYSECPGIGTYKDRKHGDHYGYRRRWFPKEDRRGTGLSIAKPTEYAILQGAPKEDSCEYWLRSLGRFWGHEAIADKEGWLDSAHFGSSAGVRPVITLDLTTEALNYIRKHNR